MPLNVTAGYRLSRQQCSAMFRLFLEEYVRKQTEPRHVHSSIATDLHIYRNIQLGLTAISLFFLPILLPPNLDLDRFLRLRRYGSTSTIYVE